MSKESKSTRRSFLKNGAVLAAPLVAATPATVLADDGLRTRLARLEDEAAIRELHQNWLRHINSGSRDAEERLFANPNAAEFEEGIRSVALDHSGEPDAIELTSDGKSARGCFHCALEIETAIPQDCTLAQMAHAQGGGFVRRAERRILRAQYVRSDGVWSIAKIGFGNA